MTDAEEPRSSRPITFEEVLKIHRAFLREAEQTQLAEIRTAGRLLAMMKKAKKQ